MKTYARSLAFFTLLACPAWLAAQDNTLTAKEKADGWILLFDGKSLDGWHSTLPPARGGAKGGGQKKAAPAQAKAAPAGGAPAVGSAPNACVTDQGKAAVPPRASHWEVVNGILTPCADGPGYLTSDQSYKNFMLSLEFRCAEDTNSGVFFRSPEENGGYEVQIWKAQPAGFNTGGIVNTAKTSREFKFKPNEWNRYEITADGDHLVVILNGETTLDVHDAQFAYGNLRLQYQNYPIVFRNIKLKQLN